MAMADYWSNRSIEDTKRIFQDSEDYVKHLADIYNSEIDNLNKEIFNHLTKLSDEAGGISLHGAKKLLNEFETGNHIKSLEEFTSKASGFITPEIERELNIASRRVRISRLQAMENEITKSVASLMSEEERGLFNQLTKTYENKYYHELFNLQKITGYEKIQAINKNTLEKTINAPWLVDGSNFSERIWGRGDKLINTLRQNLNHDIIRGASPDESIKNIAKTMNVSKANAGRLVMTETAAINSQANLDAYRYLDVEKYEILSTLDNRTSPICRELDRKVFPIKDYKVGITAPPFHPNCRTTTIPWYDDSIYEDENTRMARDPVTGKSVRVKDMNYKEWYKEYVVTDPKAVVLEKMWKYRHSDRKQYENYRDILDKNMPYTFEEYQDIKYNRSKEWEVKGREFREIRNIKSKSKHPEEYKDEKIKLYYELRDKGYEFTSHSLDRLINPKKGKDKEIFTKEEVLEVLKEKPNYYDRESKRTVKYYNNISVLQNEETKEIVTLNYQRFKTERWEKYEK